MAWTDIFSIPFDIAFKHTKGMLFIKNDSNNEYNKACDFRRNLLSNIELLISEESFESLHLMIFGKEYEDTEENFMEVLKTLREFMEEDNIDVIDRLIINQLICYFNAMLEHRELMT